MTTTITTRSHQPTTTPAETLHSITYVGIAHAPDCNNVDRTSTMYEIKKEETPATIMEWNGRIVVCICAEALVA